MEVVVLTIAMLCGFGFLAGSLLSAMANERRAQREAEEAKRKALEDPKQPWNWKK